MWGCPAVHVAGTGARVVRRLLCMAIFEGAKCLHRVGLRVRM